MKREEAKFPLQHVQLLPQRRQAAACGIGTRLSRYACEVVEENARLWPERNDALARRLGRAAAVVRR